MELQVLPRLAGAAAIARLCVLLTTLYSVTIGALAGYVAGGFDRPVYLALPVGLSPAHLADNPVE